jgi:hypothetical protein
MSKEVLVCVQCGSYVLVELLMAQIDARPQDQTPLELVYILFGDHHERIH